MRNKTKPRSFPNPTKMRKDWTKGDWTSPASAAGHILAVMIACALKSITTRALFGQMLQYFFDSDVADDEWDEIAHFVAFADALHISDDFLREELRVAASFPVSDIAAMEVAASRAGRPFDWAFVQAMTSAPREVRTVAEAIKAIEAGTPTHTLKRRHKRLALQEWNRVEPELAEFRQYMEAQAATQSTIPSASDEGVTEPIEAQPQQEELVPNIFPLKPVRA